MKLKALMLLAILATPVAVYRAGQVSGRGNIEELQRLFQNPPDDSRIMMRWWWFGPAVTEPELEREMRMMKEGGIGGFEVQPVYPLDLDNAGTGFRNLPYLSDEFLDRLRFTAARARELGLRFDLTLGSGWPYGGPTVPIEQASGRLRVERINVAGGAERVALPAIGAGEKLIAVFAAPADGSAREITDIRDGAAWLPSGLAGRNTVYVFISSRTRMQVKRPAVGAEGFVLDHLDPKAIDGYLSSVGDRLMQAVGSNRPYAIFADSLEVYNADWTDNFLEEFQRRRGYDLRPNLVALVAGADANAAALRHDWGKTLTELFNDRFLAPLGKWAHEKGTRLRAQAYGTPAVALSSNAHVDLSEGEGLQWDRLSATRWASSANHIYGRPVTSSETWTWLNSPPFAATPLDMKAEADRHFLQGINQLIGHGWPYSPASAPYPGWHFYAAGAFNDQNPWWIVMPDVTRYLQRVSFLMRQGQPVNDVAIYLPNDDAWSGFRSGSVSLFEVLRQRLGTDLIPAVLGAGYNFDFFDDDAFRQTGKVDNGALRLGPNAYRAVILPNVEQIPLDTLQKLEEFARGGGTLIATRRIPAEAPGRRSTAQERQTLTEVARRLFESPSARGYFVLNETADLAKALTVRLQPDATFSPVAPQVGSVHRRTEDADIYFVANTSNARASVSATFRVKNGAPEWWDPSTGRVTSASVEAQSESAVTVHLDLEPYDSRVLVFTGRPRQSAPRGSDGPPEFVDMRAGWRVSFGPNGASQLLENLRSWTDDPETRFFSGVATYEKTIGVPDRMLRDGAEVRLDFGDARPADAEAPRAASVNGMRTAIEAPVRDAAVVYINGRRAGSVWRPPYSVDVTGLLQPGLNQVRIDVANTAMNDMAGHPLPDYRQLNQRYGERFQVQDLQRVRPLPSGLLGVIRLVATGAAR
ncbi:MAG TPA: glycosyl hydrolase [Terriglobia bacterium]|nr:glycosyl hydrolase [Terriglobia bacterium]